MRFQVSNDHNLIATASKVLDGLKAEGKVPLRIRCNPKIFGDAGMNATGGTVFGVPLVFDSALQIDEVHVDVDPEQTLIEGRPVASWDRSLRVLEKLQLAAYVSKVFDVHGLDGKDVLQAIHAVLIRVDMLENALREYMESVDPKVYPQFEEDYIRAKLLLEA